MSSFGAWSLSTIAFRCYSLFGDLVYKENDILTNRFCLQTSNYLRILSQYVLENYHQESRIDHQPYHAHILDQLNLDHQHGNYFRKFDFRASESESKCFKPQCIFLKPFSFRKLCRNNLNNENTNIPWLRSCCRNGNIIRYISFKDLKR